MTTIATIGYGDITPQTIPEYFYSILVMFIGSLIFAYNINQVGIIF